jgi:hypothetical protein
MAPTPSNPLLLRIAITTCPVRDRKARNPKFCSRSARLNRTTSWLRVLGFPDQVTFIAWFPVAMPN